MGLTGVSLGLIHAIEQQGIKLCVFKPIAQSHQERNKLDQHPTILVAEPLARHQVAALLSSNQEDILMEQIVGAFAKHKKDADVVLVEGIVPSSVYPFANEINYKIAKTLGAEIIFVTAMGSDSAEQLAERIKIARNNFGGVRNEKITGVIVDKINAPGVDQGLAHPDSAEIDCPLNVKKEKISAAQLQRSLSLPLLAAIPWNSDLNAYRTFDIVQHLEAKIINEGDSKNRRIKDVFFCAGSIPNMVPHLRPNTLLVISADRSDVLVAAALAVMNGVQIGSILVTGGAAIEKTVLDLCKEAFATGIPVFRVNTNIWQTSLNLQNINLEVSSDDKEQIELIQHFVADHVDKGWLKSLTRISTKPCLSPSAFRYKLTKLAQQAQKRIVLPEGNEPRTIKAAAICAERNMAQCILLGKRNEIERIAAKEGVTLGAGIEVIDPDRVRDNYVSRLVELRKKKGITPILAQEQLADNVVLGTLMLEQDEVDGLVSGAVHTTANTIRPPLQLIKTAPGSSLVSSIFFMLMPDQVYLYGDCAINPNPSAAELAEIAIQSADTATAFGIEPRVAMISYSTGNSGQGEDVEKVKEATRIAQQKRPDIKLDGPLQYDASVMPDVAKVKAPDSPVAGNANVFIFPDLNTGNTTYKAVQRSANVVSIGPMLQGMRKPVNDLSRGALVDDIVYTIALTAIQATQSGRIQEKAQS